MLGVALFFQFGGFHAFERQDTVKVVRVEQDGVVIYEKALKASDAAGEAEILRFTGSAGEYVIEIKDGKVRMLSALCPDKLCVRQGWVAHAYEPIICLPQKVIVSIEEERKEQDIDAIVK